MNKHVSLMHPAIDHRFAVHRQRLTVGYPEGSRKTLVDLWEPGLILRWSNAKLAEMDAFKNIGLIKPTDDLGIMPDLPPGWRRTFKRLDNLPVLRMDYLGAAGRLRCEVAGGSDADMVKIAFTSKDKDQAPLVVNVFSERAFNCADGGPVLMRSNGTVYAFATGDLAWAKSWHRCGRSLMRLTLKPGAGAAWVIIPHAETEKDVSTLNNRDWSREWKKAVGAWRKCMARAVRFSVPDPKFRNAYYACLADQFILREPMAGGGVGFLCGTDEYRAVNAYEINMHVQAMLRAGFADEAWEAAKVLLPRQKENGRWEDISSWITTFWHINGDIPMLFNELYRFTGNRERMREIYPQLVKLARWVETERAKSNSLPADDPRHGLMPAGVGDGGICRDLNMAQGKGPHHVFFMHNSGNVTGLRITAELAREFGTHGEAAELEASYADARKSLVASMERCAVSFPGGRYVPASTEGAAGGGSLWGCADFAYPGHLLPLDHSLVSGTLSWFEANLSPSGLPFNTGWQSHGVWPGGIMENPAPVYLRRGEVDKLTLLVYAALNHGSPVWTWPEERQTGAGTCLESGDLQEAWFPTTFCRLFRDLFLYEEDNTLHLAAGIPRSWHSSGAVGVSRAPSYFGPVSYRIECDWKAAFAEVTGEIGGEGKRRSVALHLNLPDNRRVTEILGAESASEVRVESDRILFDADGTFSLRLRLSPPIGGAT